MTWNGATPSPRGRSVHGANLIQRPRPWQLGVLLATLCAQVVGSSAHASPGVGAEGEARRDALTADQRLTAAGRDAFRRGARLARQARWSDAILAFARSYRLRPHPVTSFNLGFSERAIGRFTRAIKYFERALNEDQHARLGQLSIAQRAAAASYLREVFLQVGQVRVNAQRGTRLAVDGRPAEPRVGRPSELMVGTLDATESVEIAHTHYTLLVDQGPHVFVFSRPGHADVVVTRNILHRNNAPIRVRFTKATRSRGAVADRTASMLVGGVGLAAVGIGAISGIAALSKRAELGEACGASGQRCPTYAQGDIDAMQRYADVSTAAFVSGAIGLGVSVWLWFSAGPAVHEQPGRSGHAPAWAPLAVAF